jgi:hypothetical protein
MYVLTIAVVKRGLVVLVLRLVSLEDEAESEV